MFLELLDTKAPLVNQDNLDRRVHHPNHEDSCMLSTAKPTLCRNVLVELLVCGPATPFFSYKETRVPLVKISVTSSH